MMILNPSVCFLLSHPAATTTRPEDQGTRGPEDRRTGGPGDQRTGGPEDRRTRGPGDQRTKKKNQKKKIPPLCKLARIPSRFLCWRLPACYQGSCPIRPIHGKASPLLQSNIQGRPEVRLLHTCLLAGKHPTEHLEYHLIEPFDMPSWHPSHSNHIEISPTAKPRTRNAANVFMLRL